MSERLFYVQNGYVGNSMLWWKHNNAGYACDIRQARMFTQEELGKMQSIKEGSKKAWPKDYIDQRAVQHVDSQDCNYEQANSSPSDETVVVT